MKKKEADSQVGNVPVCHVPFDRHWMFAVVDGDAVARPAVAFAVDAFAWPFAHVRQQRHDDSAFHDASAVYDHSPIHWVAYHLCVEQVIKVAERRHRPAMKMHHDLMLTKFGDKFFYLNKNVGSKFPWNIAIYLTGSDVAASYVYGLVLGLVASSRQYYVVELRPAVVVVAFDEGWVC